MKRTFNFKFTFGPYLYFVLGSTCILISLYKAYYLSFTHDESYSYLHFINDSFTDLISFKNWHTNNHILNSILMKYSESLFGTSEFTLRLPNLLSLILYIIFGLKLINQFDIYLKSSLAIILFLNIFILDFFCLARGYGLSFAFVLIALYYMIKSINSLKLLHILIFHFSSLLAILSHFTTICFYLATLLAFVIIYLMEFYYNIITSKTIMRLVNYHLLFLLLIGCILYEPIRRLITYNELISTMATTFLDTLITIIGTFINNLWIFQSNNNLIKILLTIFIFLPILLLFITLLFKKINFYQNNRNLIITSLVFIITILLIYIQHIIFNSDYPVGRFALFLLLIFIIYIGYFLNWILTKNHKLKLLILSTFITIYVFGFVKKFNLNSISEWNYDSNTKYMLEILKIEHECKEIEKSSQIKLGISWIFEPTINFYIKTKSLNWINKVDRNKINYTEDYCYVQHDEFVNFPLNTYEVIHIFETSKSVLVKRLK